MGACGPVHFYVESPRSSELRKDTASKTVDGVKSTSKAVKKRGGKLPLWIVAAGLLALALSAGWIAASESTDALDRQFGREIERYYASLYVLTNATPTVYSFVAKYYTFDKGVTLPDYKITLDFVKEVVKNFRENAATY